MRILIAGAVVLVMLFGVGCGGESSEKGTSVETPRQATQEDAVTVEETTAPRETTEATTGFEFEVGRTPMDEDADDRDVARRREVVVEKAVQPPSESQEEQYPPEPESSDTECRFFTQSEFANATPEQKAFIRECDRAAGRPVPSPSEKEADAKEASQERATQPEPQPPLPAPPEPQPKASPTSGDVDCGDLEGLPPGEKQAYLLPGDPYDLDRDNDGIACA